jgi:hypothetical protein
MMTTVFKKFDYGKNEVVWLVYAIPDRRLVGTERTSPEWTARLAGHQLSARHVIVAIAMPATRMKGYSCRLITPPSGVFLVRCYPWRYPDPVLRIQDPTRSGLNI